MLGLHVWKLGGKKINENETHTVEEHKGQMILPERDEDNLVPLASTQT